MDADQPVPARSATASFGNDALAESSERYASLFTHHPHAAYSVDRHGTFTDANARALEMTGLSLQQMRETHFSQVIHPDTLHLIEEGFERAMAGEPQLVDARVLRADGEIIDIRCTAIPIVVDGEVVGVHGVTEDVTHANAWCVSSRRPTPPRPCSWPPSATRCAPHWPPSWAPPTS